MKSLDLLRIEQGEDGTFGVLRLDGKAWCVTLEPQDLGNAENVSCIPAGRYVCRRVHSPHFGETFQIADVPGRSHILLHAGNVAGDTRGCVLLGRRFGSLEGCRAVLDSGRTVAEFMAELAGEDEFSLVVRDVSREAA
ncbi:hypothetical protein GM415_05835 [Pseudodesulfovibrio cashew]|uniref:DUF5675 domain-containing protein n=1 Tax=Pseudodesulfovibrio cashew TaxID=2678688 RepID=A0A6I6JA06_9BACT|nr:DUF5675 family protein [Pseudodesulfovibrio cashew]QGY39656.1 hypothetical protein GM415_05835 [Pseudodesulfovibrio cashew]